MTDSVSRFCGQFLIHSGGELPDGFRRIPLRGQFLDVDAALPLTRVLAGGEPIGWLLGWPFDCVNRSFLSGKCDMPTKDGETHDQLIERSVYSLAGSFLFLLDTPEATRLYLDANGTLSAVYDPQAGIVAATADLALGDEYDSRLRPDLIRAFEAQGDGWFSAGLTAHSGLKRLICNHYLDLRSFETRRHWPEVMPHPDGDAAQLCDEIAGEVEAVIEGLAATYPIVQLLTGGNETRMLLACARRVCDRIEFATVSGPNMVDRSLTNRLVSRYRLNHRYLLLRRANLAAIDLWDRRVGHTLAGSNRPFHPTVQPLAGRIVIGGLGGEVGRGFLWPAQDPGRIDDTSTLIARLKLPAHPTLVDAVEEWRKGLPEGITSLQFLDIAYLELRMSTWAYAQAYTQPDVIELHPLTSRAQFTRMWSLPAEERRKNGLVTGVIRARWPELLEIPINRYGDWRDRLEPLRRAISRPDRAFRKIRQIVRT